MKRTYTVVIPAFNAELTLGACLQSVVAQSLAALEVIVVDDRSVDGTAAVVEQWRARLLHAGIVLRYVLLDVNSGPSIARNTAMRMATGQFIAFLDSDDAWRTDKLAIVDRFINDTAAGLICHSYADTATVVISPVSHVAVLLSKYHMLLRNPAQTSCAVVRRDLGLVFDERMRYCEDYDLWLRIAEVAPVLCLIGSPLTQLGRPQLSAGGLSGNVWKMRMGEMQVYRNFCKRGNAARIFLLPLLIVVSMMKHVYSRTKGVGANSAA